MKTQFKEISGSIVAPIGFMASGVFCDIKKLGTGKGSNKGRKRDLALIVSEAPAAVAGHVHHQSGVRRAGQSVRRARQTREPPRWWWSIPATPTPAPVGRGWRTRAQWLAFTERALNLSAGRVLVGSTGRIGVALPMDNVRAGIVAAAAVARDHAGTRGPRHRGHHDERHPAQANRGGVQAGRPNGAPGRHLQRRGHDPAGHERHRQTSRRPAARRLHATMLCFLTTDAAIDAQGACRRRLQRPWRTVSTASPWTAT